MGRRGGKILRELCAIGRTLPWWMTVPLALGTYVLLHRYAVSDPIVAADPRETPGTALPLALRQVAVYAQYIVPWIILVVMLSSVLRRATRAQLFARPPEERRSEKSYAEAVYAESPAEAYAEPACPRCRGRMVRRTAKRGPNAGNHFWGCSRFPACHGTRELEHEESCSLPA